MQFLRPQFATKLNQEQRDNIINLAKDLLDSLSVDRPGIDDQHASRRYARFLQSLLRPHIQDVAARRRAEEALPHISAYEARPRDPSVTYRLGAIAHDAGPVPTPAADQQHGYASQPFDPHMSHSIWDDTFMSSSDHGAVPMPPIMGFPDPVFLASMFSCEQADPTSMF